MSTKRPPDDMGEGSHLQAKETDLERNQSLCHADLGLLVELCEHKSLLFKPPVWYMAATVNPKTCPYLPSTTPMLTQFSAVSLQSNSHQTNLSYEVTIVSWVLTGLYNHIILEKVQNLGEC